MVGHSVTATPKLLQERGETFRDRLVGGTVLGPQPLPQFPQPWPEMSTTDATAREHLRRALDGLPATWRAVVDRHDIAGRSDTDIAAELGITHEQVRSILTRARAALRDQLADLLGRGGGR